jgi:hypothetical protein
MFAESGRARESLRPMTAAFEQWLVPRLNDGSYFGWTLEEAGVVIASLGMMVIDWRRIQAIRPTIAAGISSTSSSSPRIGERGWRSA